MAYEPKRRKHYENGIKNGDFICLMMLLNEGSALALNYGIEGRDAAGDPYNWSAYGFNGVSSDIYVFNAYVALGSEKVNSINARGAITYGDGLPDFAEVGWFKDGGGVPRFFVAWHNSNGYGQVDYSAASYPLYHHFSVTYQTYNPSGYGGKYLWYGYYDNTFALQVWNRNAYAAPITNEEHNSGADDGYSAFSNILEWNSYYNWQSPSNLAARQDQDPWYWFNKNTIFPFNTAWQASRG